MYDGHTDAVALLLKNERTGNLPAVSDTKQWNDVAVQLASEHGHIDAVALLLRDKRSVSRRPTVGA